MRLMVDLCLLWRLCAPLERLFGPWVCAFVFVVGGAGGNLLGSVVLPHWLSTGPGPGLMAAVGALLWVQVFHLPGFGLNGNLLFLLLLVAVALVFGCFPGVDNWAQVGGLVFGFVAAANVLATRSRRLSAPAHYAIVVCTTMAHLVLLALLLTVLFARVDVDSPCTWCADATCYPSHDWCNSTLRLARSS